MATGRLPDPNTAPVTAKGDLYTYSTVPARLAVGNNGDTLVADSSTTTGLRWQADWNTGKNKIINGDFGINQRAFTSATTSGTFGFDRWATYRSNSSFTFSAQTFTPGTAPVAGYEGINFARGANTTDSTSGEFCIITQRMEDVRTFAGQTVTVSFWAKASSGTPKLGVELRQTFGSGGSAAVDGTGQSVTLSTSWARYSVTISVPSISGKTVGTSSYLELILWFSAGSTYATRSGSVGNQTATIDFWGVQAEAGSVATPFTTATGTLAGELAACQRYFQRYGDGSSNLNAPYIFGGMFEFGDGAFYGGTAALGHITLPIVMRSTPTMTTTGTWKKWTRANHNDTGTLSIQIGSNQALFLRFEKSSGTWTTEVGFVGSENGGYVNLSSEL